MFSHCQILLLVLLPLLLSCPAPRATTFETFRSRLAVDYGPRLCGVATCDPFGNIQPYCTFANGGDLTSLSRQILHKARADGVVEILVGLPLDSNGKMSHKVRNFNGQLCLNFSSVLSSVASVELPRVRVLLVDERYTTREAKARMKAERIRASLDAMSAACLLERYMEDKGEGALAPQMCAYPPPKDLDRFDYDTVRRHIREQYYDSPQSFLERKRKVMQKLKDGVLKGKHHIYFEDQSKSIVESREATAFEIQQIESEVDDDGDGNDDDEDGDYGDGQDEEDAENEGEELEEGALDDEGEELEEEEIDETEAMLEIRNGRRKRGTLRRKGEGGRHSGGV